MQKQQKTENQNKGEESKNLNDKDQEKYRCKKCRKQLFSPVVHSDKDCTSIFIQQPQWLKVENFQNQIKFNCPKCSTKLGDVIFSGKKCSCGKWITPAFQLKIQDLIEKDSKNQEIKFKILIQGFNSDFLFFDYFLIMTRVNFSQKFMIEHNQQSIDKQQQIFIPCYFCHFSEQEALCYIYPDSKCHRFYCCIKCFNKNKNKQMQCECKLSLKQHIKFKVIRKEQILDEGKNAYERQYKVRSSWDMLDSNFVNLLAFYFRNNKGNQYNKRKKEVEHILNDLEKKQNQINRSLKNMEGPKFLSSQKNDQTGKDACGYKNSYEKGLKFLFDAFKI